MQKTSFLVYLYVFFVTDFKTLRSIASSNTAITSNAISKVEGIQLNIYKPALVLATRNETVFLFFLHAVLGFNVTI